MGIRDTTYYSWSKVLDIKASDISSASYNFNAIHFNDVKSNPTNNDIVYAVGALGTIYSDLPTTPQLQRNWFVIRTINSWKSWELVDFPSAVDCLDAKSLAFDISGSVYVCGYHAIRKSTTGNVDSWTTVDTPENSQSRYTDIKTSISGGVVAVGIYGSGSDVLSGFIRGSNNGSSGSFVNLCNPADTISNVRLQNLEIFNSASIETILVTGFSGADDSSNFYRSIKNPIPSSITAHSGNFTSSSFTLPNGESHRVVQMAISGSKIFAAAGDTAGIVLSSSDNGKIWNIADRRNEPINSSQHSGICKDSNGSLYVIGWDGIPDFDQTSFFYIRRSDAAQHHTGSFVSIFESDRVSNNINEQHYISARAHIDIEDNIYICTHYGLNAQTPLWDSPYDARRHQTDRAALWIGKRTANSSSLGPRMLATSFGYTIRESSGSIEEQFNLNNISEFPHSSGLFQMKNIVLGTVSQGRVGKTDDAIIQKRFIGSFVRVLFPRQDTDSDIKGYDAAKKPGKLSTEWQWGDTIDIEGKNFDHLALNCVVSKQVSGTLDSILIRIETKPLGDSGYFIDQSTTTATSGSFSSETTYFDDLHRKDVDYGDLSLSEISWKIDQDLTNIKSLRIACRQKNGQSDDKNKQLLILGRFITKSKDHNET